MTHTEFNIGDIVLVGYYSNTILFEVVDEEVWRQDCFEANLSALQIPTRESGWKFVRRVDGKNIDDLGKPSMYTLPYQMKLVQKASWTPVKNRTELPYYGFRE